MRNYTTSISALSLCVLSMCTTSAFAVDGTITFNGKITDTTCIISVDGAGNNTTVTLPTVSAGMLKTTGVTAGATPFNISLSSCSGTTLKTASTYFEPGAYVDNTTGRLNIDNAAGSAKNVQIELLNSNRGSIVVGASVSNGQNDIPVDISTGNAVLNYYAQYYATDASVAGSVATQVDYTITYE